MNRAVEIIERVDGRVRAPANPCPSREEWEELRAYLTEEPTYEEIQALKEKVEPWVHWFSQVEGTELGDMMRALEDAEGACVSGQEYRMAYHILTFQRDYFLGAVEEGWWEEMVEMADNDYEDLLADYSEERQAEMRKTRPKPSEALKKLPTLRD